MARKARFSIMPIRTVVGVPDDIEFDATTSRTPSREGQAIRHAKEAGQDELTDDVLLGSTTIEATAHFVDFPLYTFGYEGRSNALVSAVRALHASKVRSTMIVGDDIYTSMVIESISEPVTTETGDAVDLEITCVQVEVGELQLVEAVVDAQTQALGDIDAVDIGWLP